MRGMIAALVVAAALSPASGRAQDLAEYRRFRDARFSEVQKANPDMERKIAEVKAGTVALLAAVPSKLAPVESAPAIWRVPSTLPFVLDDPVAPRMVIVPAGEFTFGSPSGEKGRFATTASPRRIRIAYTFAVSMFPVTFAEFSLFAAETGHVAKSGCFLPRLKGPSIARDWRNPGFLQTFRSPAVCIGNAEARIYAAWLSKKTGHRYRLLSEAEYEYAQRAGSTSTFWWGDDRKNACSVTNGWDLDATPSGVSEGPLPCRDGSVFTAELDKPMPNEFGLYDMAGNVASWTTDCWSFAQSRPAGNGSPDHRQGCRFRVVRGGSWATSDLRSSARRKEAADAVRADLGFRLARDL